MNCNVKIKKLFHQVAFLTPNNKILVYWAMPMPHPQFLMRN